MFFPSGDGVRCAEQVAALLANPDQRAKLVVAGRDLARNSYSWANYVAKTEEIYRQAEEHVRAKR